MVLEPSVPAFFNVIPAPQMERGAVKAEGFGKEKGGLELRILDTCLPKARHPALEQGPYLHRLYRRFTAEVLCHR
jgi:hypothetical protein